jgi:hypothetical protein
MKKFISVCVLFNLLISPAFAVETMSVITHPVPLQAEMIKDKFIGYNVILSNKGKNPVKISTIEVQNIVNNANSTLVSLTLKDLQKNNKYAYMSIFTLGITSLVCLGKNDAILNKQKAALAEAATFGTQATLESMKSEIIMPNGEKSIKVLVPLNNAPIVECLFQDVRTNEYIEAKNGK